MSIVKNILSKIHRFMSRYYAYISFISVCTLGLTAFFHFELKQNNRDLIYWKEFLQQSVSEMENCAIFIILAVMLLKVIFIASVIIVNCRSMGWCTEMSQLEVKKRYADLLFLRLIRDIDQIQRRYLGETGSQANIELKYVVMAHAEMTRTIETFRKDARKLFTPNEMEVSLPIEDVYGFLAADEASLKNSRFYNMKIRAKDDVIKKILNP